MIVSETSIEELLNFFKALSDANRLKIVGLLAQGPASVEKLSEMLHLHPSTVSHHLSRLSKAGLVSAQAEGYYSIYQLESKTIESMAKRLLEKETLPSVTRQVDIDAYDRKVLQSFMTPEGRIKDFPAQQKKLEIVLKQVVQAFEPGRRYAEKEVNLILANVHEDTARLRRNLVEFKLMAREGGGGEYWRIN
jgi:DNA-binding HxlR family transcriptional regulator